MKNVYKKILISFLAFLLIFSVVGSPVSSAKSNSNDQEIESLAEDLEFLMEEASIYDSNNKLVGFNFDKLTERFGEIEELQILEKEIKEGTCEPKETSEFQVLAAKGTWGDCMIDALKDHFGVALIEVALTGGLWTYLEQKAYKEAAKLLLKIGIGGNVIGLVAFLTWYSAKCLEGRGPWAK
ncbi:hypothetical protein ACINLE_18930 [Bacillus sp. z60-18]|uniref:hypothetical protein n=1 Tax=unclassified Bacillus (in: firmicutes) TaxID=185979 RepID=UPI002409E557|nr:hypothetical protein [Bacillus sp. HSf4]WFA07094.1 hypothetical protein P3X63_10155 [Bacillus sp. HSf4]